MALTALRDGGGTTSLATISGTCAGAYCGKLTSRPALCDNPPAVSTDEYLGQIRELDEAILRYEFGDEHSVLRILALRLDEAVRSVPAGPLMHK